MAEKRWEGEREGTTSRNSGVRGGIAIAGGKEVVGEWETRPSGLGLRIREHRGRKGVHATSARPRTGPEVTAEAVVAMAGGVKLVGAHELGPRGQVLQS